MQSINQSNWFQLLTHAVDNSDYYLNNDGQFYNKSIGNSNKMSLTDIIAKSNAEIAILGKKLLDNEIDLNSYHLEAKNIFDYTSSLVRRRFDKIYSNPLLLILIKIAHIFNFVFEFERKNRELHIDLFNLDLNLKITEKIGQIPFIVSNTNEAVKLINEQIQTAQTPNILQNKYNPIYFGLEGHMLQFEKDMKRIGVNFVLHDSIYPASANRIYPSLEAPKMARLWDASCAIEKLLNPNGSDSGDNKWRSAFELSTTQTPLNHLYEILISEFIGEDLISWTDPCDDEDYTLLIKPALDPEYKTDAPPIHITVIRKPDNTIDHLEILVKATYNIVEKANSCGKADRITRENIIKGSLSYSILWDEDNKRPSIHDVKQIYFYVPNISA